jgi:LmbE family N-acetylglucosaminyl deacetylase
VRILYVFPHPEDESFGPSRAISAQVRAGHEVLLLTMTRGGATKQRHRLGYTVEKMGEVRYREMQDVARVLGLSDLSVLDFPDSGLDYVDPRELESAVVEHARRVRPDVMVTYAVHGISGFHDHLVGHAAVKRAFVELREEDGGPRRLAFFTVTEEQAARAAGGGPRIAGSKPGTVDCIMNVDEEDMAAFRKALDCYVTYQEVIKESGVREELDEVVPFEIFQESFDPPISDLFEGLERTGQ